MPSSNPVYQPTTVTYERHKESNYLTDTVIPNCHQKPALQRLLLVGAIFLAAVGLSLTIYALVNDVNTHVDAREDAERDGKPVFDPSREESPTSSEEETEIEVAASDEAVAHNHELNVVLGSVGICLVLLSLGMYVCFLRVRGVCTGLLSCPPLTRSGHSRGSNQESGDVENHAESGHAVAVSYKEVQVSACYLDLFLNSFMDFSMNLFG